MLRQWLICLFVFLLSHAEFAQNNRSKKAIDPEPVLQDLFILQKNKVYGFADSTGWVQHTPTGDTLFHLGDLHFVLRDSLGFYNIYDGFLKNVYPKADLLKEFGDFALVKDPNGWKVLSMIDYTTNGYFDSVQVNGDYVWLFKNGKQGILQKNWMPEDMILPEYDKVGLYHDGVLVIKNDKLGWKGVLSIPVEFDHIYKERQDILAAKNSRGTIYYCLTTQQKLLIEPGDSVVFYSEFYKRVRGKQHSIFNLKTNTLVGETSNYQIHPFSFDHHSSRSNNYCVVTKDSACALFKNGNVLTEFVYDNFLPESTIHPPFFRSVKDNKVGLINDKGEVILKTEYTDVIDKNGDYYIVRLGNKLGLYFKQDSMVLPAKYQSISFYRNKYACVSFDGNSFGLYNFMDRKEITLCKYSSFKIDSIFILARHDDRNDIYFREQLKFFGLYDVQSNDNTVKGYKDSKIYIGSLRNNTWEEYNYEIPSYKVVSDKNKDFPFRPFDYADIEDMYDYSTGKWGYYSFNAQNWADEPLSHSGDNANGTWILGFHQDTIINWNGINFHSSRSISPINIAWQKKSKYHWMDVNSYSYSSDDGNNYHYSISPVCYTVPGKGSCMSNYKNTVNAIFKGKGNYSVIADNGQIEVAKYGDIRLSDYICQLSTNGNIHPGSILDYEKLIDPSAFIRFKGSSEHVLQHSNRNNRHISVFNSFDWLDKNDNDQVIFRFGTKYGMLSDSGSYILKPEYESISTLKIWGASILKVGVKAEGSKLYNPKTNSFSKLIAHVLDKKGELLAVQLDDGKQAVLTMTLDTLIKTNGIVKLIGDKDYTILYLEKNTVYREQQILFTYEGDHIEKINNEHFVIHSLTDNQIINDKGHVLFKSQRTIKYLSLADHYLLDDGAQHTLFGKDDAVIYQFQKLPYLANDNRDLIIKDENSVLVFPKNSTQKIKMTGKYTKVTKKYMVLNLEKYKRVYSLQGEVILLKAKQVKVLNDEYLSYQEGKSFYLLNVVTKEKKKIKSLNINLSKEGIDYEDMDESLQTLAFKTEDSLSVEEYKGMYGLKSGNKTVLSNRYFQIEKIADMYLVQDKIEYKLFNPLTRKFITENSYDAVYPYKGYIMLFKKGVISYINPYGRPVN